MASATAVAAAAELIPANAKRQSIVIQNTGTVSVYLGDDDTVTSGNAVSVIAAGNLEEDNSGGRMWKGPYFGLTGQGTSAVVVYWERESNL